MNAQDAVNLAEAWFVTLAERFKECSLNDIAIAGGMPRDLVLGKEIGDLDFYIRASQVPESLLNNRLIDLGFTTGKRSGYGGPFRTYTHTILPVQVMDISRYYNSGGSTIQNFVSQSFDTGLCKILVYGNGTIMASDSFREDVRWGTLTVQLTEGHSQSQCKSCMTKHLPKLKLKYPTHRVAVQLPPPPGIALLPENWRIYNE